MGAGSIVKHGTLNFKIAPRPSFFNRMVSEVETRAFKSLRGEIERTEAIFFAIIEKIFPSKGYLNSLL